MSPMVVVVGCLFTFFAHAEKHGIAIVGDLKKGLNPPSIQYLNFDSRYLPATVQAVLVTGLIALAEGIAIGRSFAIMKNEQTDGNKEMIAFGLMNIIGSFTSCYLTTGPFSKTAVNFNAGCRTVMSNEVMGFCMMLTLLFLAPLFSYTPLVGLALLRALLYVARPATCKLGKVPNPSLYRDTEQYPGSTTIEGILVLQLGSPIYFANCIYIRERILMYIQEEQGISDSISDVIEHVLLDLSGVSSIDMTGIETFVELRRILEAKGIKLAIVNPRIEVLEKMTLAKFTDAIGKESFYLSIEDAVQSCRFTLKKATAESSNDQNVA
ncbi:hypothetical protein CRYUN_Cryun33cG0050200 [Craigia yunnanensis]